jgi:prepilin-type N-terminal cleavage/methylation domain-containing protein
MLISRIKKALKGSRGYTLMEVAAVVAVTATLAAVVVPVAMDKVESSKKARALEDIKSLASAIATFYSDTGVWPAYSTSSAYQSRVPDVEVLVTAGDDPTIGTNTGWSLTKTDEAHDQFVTNEPKYDFWNGPYIESLKDKKDPWGQKYVIWVKGFYTSTHDGWILSAGPNGKIDTVNTSATLSGDDIGIVLYSYQQ